ncbi:Threonine/homoserine efflux transporter RhtA [Fulvimarina manganoxydans]|uniref:Threonine/homoserine efflux transporter RhtA n=1 Tax=Fulvimarina manganoxydans TaxID=937218 RepID=A0A1W2EI74_9HYPH|nr:DMT family transporter [Fulvimarina manganoxydans]SMD09407.1 Threonine/homoserine efflux transporter RhtA [Fulvimarina manganoxydans]
MARFIGLFPPLFVLLWSTGFIGARYAMPYAEPFTFLALRFTLALAILSGLAALSGVTWPKGRQALHSIIAGSLIHGAYLGGVFFAIRHGLNAGIAALIVGLQPILTTFIAASLLGEKVSPRHGVGLCLGLAGIALVVAPKFEAGGDLALLTLAPVVGAAIAISLGIVWQKRFVQRSDLRASTALQYVGALIPTLFLAFTIETRRIEWTGELVFALLWLTLVLSIGAIFLMLVLIREGAVSKVASLMYLTPGVTALMALILFGETLNLLQAAGLVLAGAGVAASTTRMGHRSSIKNRILPS